MQFQLARATKSRAWLAGWPVHILNKPASLSGSERVSAGGAWHTQSPARCLSPSPLALHRPRSHRVSSITRPSRRRLERKQSRNDLVPLELEGRRADRAARSASREPELAAAPVVRVVIVWLLRPTVAMCLNRRRAGGRAARVSRRGQPLPLASKILALNQAIAWARRARRANECANELARTPARRSSVVTFTSESGSHANFQFINSTVRPPARLPPVALAARPVGPSRGPHGLLNVPNRSGE